MSQQNQQKHGAARLISTDGKVIATVPASLLSDVELTRPDTAGVFENRSGKSTVVMTARFTVLSVGWAITAAIYARLGKDGKMTVDASLPKGIVAKDSARDDYRAHINAAINGWSGRQRAFKEAYARLTEAKADKADKAAPLVYDPNAADELPEVPASNPAETLPAVTAAA